MNTKKIIAFCPGNRVTGGPELLHQLVFTLRQMGKESYISYYPSDKAFACPSSYEIYQAPQSNPEDAYGNLVILPEVETKRARDFCKANVAIWWLSVDNYLRVSRRSFLSDIKSNLRCLLRDDRARISELRDCLHFSQSAYAADFLSRHHLKYEYLTDYLGASHLEPLKITNLREDIVMYNPTKGMARTQRLMDVNPTIRFVPIQNMTAKEIRCAFEKAKIYLDLGHHPGKDRLPREAAMAGCCVITNRRGAAKFHEDIPIPDRYKLHDNRPNYARIFGTLVRHVFQNFDACSDDFNPYRDKVVSEQHVFQQQVRSIFL